MNAMEVMTLVLVIFAALTYIDYHNDKKKQHPIPPKVGDAIAFLIDLTEGIRSGI